MTGHRPFGELTKDFTPERRARVAAKAAVLREAMTLEELRKTRAVARDDISTARDVSGAVATESADMHVSTLRRYIEALGGTLEITARFPDASVVISDLGERDERLSGKE